MPYREVRAINIWDLSAMVHISRTFWNHQTELLDLSEYDPDAVYYNRGPTEKLAHCSFILGIIP